MTKKPASNPPDWKYPAGWVLDSPMGFMQGNDSDGKPVDLVRLADLIRWLQEARRIPRSEAIQAVIDAMPLDVMDWIYQASPGKRAALISPAHAFGQTTQESIKKARAQQASDALQRSFEAIRSSKEEFWGSNRFNTKLTFSGGRITTQKEPVPVEPGRPALLQYLKRWVAAPLDRTLNGVRFDTLDSPRDLVAYLAIPAAKAWQVWAWGEMDLVDLETSEETDVTNGLKTYAELKRYHANNKGHAWTPDMRKLLAKEEERKRSAGHTGIRKALASDFGMTESAIGQHIRGSVSGTKSGRGRKAA